LTYDRTTAPRYTAEDTIGAARIWESSTCSRAGSNDAAVAANPGRSENTVNANVTAVATSFTSTHVYATDHFVPNINTTPDTSAPNPNGTASTPARTDIAVPAAYCSAASPVPAAHTPNTSRHRLNPSQATDETTWTMTKARYAGRRSVNMPPPSPPPTRTRIRARTYSRLRPRADPR